jgi:signal transduction histidine kinase
LRLSHLVEALNGSITLGRQVIEDLRPSTLSDLGLVPTLEVLPREFAERAGIEVHCALVPATELVVYRVVQEAINNISKYAHARQVWLGMASVGGQVQVTVRDDGVGFDPELRTPSACGLAGMRFRVEAAGGTLVVEAAADKGSLIRVSLPASAPTVAT